MEEQKEYTFNALNIERLSDLDPKRYQKMSDLTDQLPAFYDPIWEELRKTAPAVPEVCTQERMSAFIDTYKQLLDLQQSKEAWFEQLKSIGKEYGFASSGAEFKE